MRPLLMLASLAVPPDDQAPQRTPRLRAKLACKVVQLMGYGIVVKNPHRVSVEKNKPKLQGLR